MSKKQRAGHRGFVKGILPQIDEFLQSDVAEKTAELLKWRETLREQLEKILPLDEEILAELVVDDKSTEKDFKDEITKSAMLKGDVTQQLAAIEEKLETSGTVPPFQPSENEATSPSSPPFNQSHPENVNRACEAPETRGTKI